jgi:hypothetical protein
VLEGQEGDGKPSALTEGNGWKALRTPRHRYVCRVNPESARANGAGQDAGQGAGEMEEHLWDVEADPGEYEDLAPVESHAGVLAQLRRHLLQRVLEQEQPLPRVWPY